MKRFQVILLLVLVGLLAIWFITDNVDEARENTFDPGFPQIDFSEIHTFKIYPQAEGGQEIIIYRSGGEWRVIKGTKDVPIHHGRIDVVFNELENLEATRLAGVSQEDWETLGVSDSTGTRLIAESDHGVELDIVIGDFEYRDAKKEVVERAPPGTRGKRGITHVRLTNSERVFSAEGFFGPNLNQEFVVWRNQQIIEIDPTKLDSIRFIYPENSEFTIRVGDSGWYYGDQQVRLEAQNAYGGLITNKNFTYFADGFEAERPPLFQVKYHLKSGEVVELDAFEANSGQIIIQSSQNPETFFLDFDDQLLDQLFPPLYFFVDRQEGI